MNKNRVTKFLSILLTMCMLLGMLPMTALADNFSDIKGHWAESQINEMINEGIVKGYPDGSFKPDGDISRAEFVSLIVKAFKLTKAKGKDFDDISNHWAKDAILTANAHGIVNGYSDTKFGPDDPITREQMAVIIVKVAHLTDNSKGKTFVDSQDISEWAKKAVAIASSNQLITGYPDNTFKPSGNASRAEATVVLSKSLTIVNLPVEIDYSSIENSGKYGPETGDEIVKGDVVIKAKDTILQNLVIKGDLTIAKEVGDGDVTLNNIKVEGKTYIRGGGTDSIYINGGEYREIIIERTVTGAVRIIATDIQGLPITITEGDNGEDVILGGEIKTVTIKASGIKLISQGKTTIDKIEVIPDLKDVKIQLTEDTEVKEIILNSKVDVKGKGKIDKASGSKIRESTFERAPKRIITPSTGGNGSSSSGGTSTTPTIKVSAININKSTTTLVEGTTETLTVTFTPSNASNKTITWTTSDASKATIDSTGKVRAVSAGTATITAKSNNGKTATCVVTVTTTVVPVSAISVKGTGDVATITTDGGTLQMIATVSPANASNKTVTWSVDKPEIATINSSGLLTAVANGTVEVTATAKDGSGVTGTATIEISGQTAVPVVDKTALTAALAEADSKVEADYTAASWAEFQTDLTAAKAMAEETQAEVDAKLAAVNAAISKLVEETPVVDKTALTAALAEADSKVEADYTAASWAEFQTDLTAAKAMAEETQAEVDAKLAAVNAAISKLVEETPVVDKTALTAALAEADSKVEADYTAASWAEFQTDLTAAKAMAEETQAEVDAKLAAVNAAISKLVEETPVVDKTALTAALAEADSKVEADYTAASWAEFQTDLTAAKAMAEETQAEVDAKLAAVNAAISKLVEETPVVDKTALTAALAEADSKVEADYTAASWAEFQTDLTAAKAMAEETQAEVDAKLAAVNAAISKLVEETPVVDKTALTAALAEADSKVEADYTAASWAEFQTDLTAAKAMAEETQAEVDAKLAAVNAAISKLVEETPVVDKTALTAALAEADSKVEADYTAASWAEFQTDLTAAKAMAEETQAEVDAKLAAVNAAISKLVEETPVVDKTALTAALAEADSKMEADYTAASWAEFQTDLTAAKAMAEETQAEVDAKLAAVNAAISKLVEETPVVDKTALTAALAEADSKVEADYTAASWAEFQTDLTAAKAMAEGTQAEVDAKLAAVNAAISKLVEETPVVDKTALTAALAEADSKVEADYTAASWAEFQTDLTAAKAMAEETQAEVDAKLAAVNAAISKLVEETPVVDKTALTAALAEADSKVEADYTAASWAEFQTDLTAAKAMAEETQAEVDAKLAAVNAAMGKLVLKIASVVTFEETGPVEKTVSDAAFTNAATGEGAGVITYASDAPAVAIVNENTGEVTIVGVGTATITASQAESDTHLAGTASYTLNVTTPPITKTVTVGDLQGGDIKAGISAFDRTYEVSTTNIADGASVLVNWYKDELKIDTYDKGYVKDEYGIEVYTQQKVLNNSVTLETIFNGSKTKQGDYFFTVTIDGVESGVKKLTIEAAPNIIEAVTIDGMVAPAVSNTPVTRDSLSVATGGCNIDELSWYNITDSTGTVDSFEAGKQYKARIIFNPEDGYAFGSTNPTIKLTGVDSNLIENTDTWVNVIGGKQVEIVFKELEATTYDITTNKVGGTATVTTNPSDKASEGETVTVTITNIEAGKELLGLTITNVDKKDITEVTPGSVYTFDMPANDVTVEVTVGEPDKKVKIGGAYNNDPITLKNGSITVDSAGDPIDEGTLTWSYFTEELTMNDYEGEHIQGESGSVPITIRVVGKENKITAETEALLFNNPNIVGTDKDNDKLSIVVSEFASRAIFNNVSIKNATLEIEANLKNASNTIRGVDGFATVDGGDLIVRVNKISTNNTQAWGISDTLTLKNGGTANIEVIGEEGTTRVTAHNGAPWISSASKVVAAYTAGDGADADNPLSMTVTVPASVTTIKSTTDTLGEGVSSILVGDSGEVTLYAADESGNKGEKLAEPIELAGGSTIFYAETSDGVWFKITVIRDAATQSNDASISTIKVNGVEATAGSDNNYNVELEAETVLADLTKDNIVVEANHNKATVGEATTNDSGKTWSVEVTAEDGTIVNYTINVTVAESTDIKVTFEMGTGSELTSFEGVLGADAIANPVTVVLEEIYRAPALSAVNVGEGYTFDGWFTDTECNTAYVPGKEAIKESITLYAKFSTIAEGVKVTTFDKVFYEEKAVAIGSGPGAKWYYGIDEVVPGSFDVFLDTAELKKKFDDHLEGKLKIKLGGRFLVYESNGITDDTFVEQGDYYALPSVQQANNLHTLIGVSILGHLAGSEVTHLAEIHLIP